MKGSTFDQAVSNLSAASHNPQESTEGIFFPSYQATVTSLAAVFSYTLFN